MHEYAVSDFRHTRRESQISLMDGCEPPCGCWDLNSGPSEEQSALLTAEPSFQPGMKLSNKLYKTVLCCVT